MKLLDPRQHHGGKKRLPPVKGHHLSCRDFSCGGTSGGTSSPRKGTLFRVIGTLGYNNKDDVENILNTLAVVAERKQLGPH